MSDYALLLGNGFSRAYDNDIFDYDALRKAAGLSPRLSDVFDTVGTTDFELVMRRLTQVVALLPPYAVPAEYQKEFKEDITLVRKSLIKALKEHHPEGAHQLDETESRTCAGFLGNFARVFTLNYDLLLYWVFMEHLLLVHNDGFGGSPLHWQGPRAAGQMVFYLHGALHLYDTGAQVRKLKYAGGTRLLEQLELNMKSGDYPLFVSEGTSAQKMARIRSNPYLFDAYEALAANDLAMGIYGFKFSNVDNHIVNAIARSQTPRLVVWIFDGDSASEKDRIKQRVRDLAKRIRLKSGAVATCKFLKTSRVKTWR